MAQTEVTNGQLQPVIASLVAGANWGNTFIGEEIFPAVNTYGEQFMYETMGNEGLVDQGTTKRGLNAASKELLPPANSSTTANLEEYSAKTPIDYRLIKAAETQDAIRPTPAEGLSSADRLRLARSRILQFNNQIQKEKAIAAIAFATASFDSGLRVTNNSVDFAATGIINTVFTAKRNVAKSYGFEPDTLVLGYTKYLNLLANADILARVSGGATNGNPAEVNLQLIAQIFGVQRVLVGKAITQTLAAPGAVGTATDLWTATSAALYYTGLRESADLGSPAFGKLFYMDVPSTGVRYDVKTWMNDEGNVEWLKAAEFFLAAQVMKAGYLWAAS